MKRLAMFLFLGVMVFAGSAKAEYAEQLRKQIDETQKRFPKGPEPAYFHDMGIIARKADDAESYDLVMEIVQTYLFGEMDKFVDSNLKKAVAQTEADPYLAGSYISGLLDFEKYYEPSGEFLNSSAGQAAAANLVRVRQEAFEKISKPKVSVADLAAGFKAYKKTGLFSVKGNAEETDLRKLHEKLDCGVSWARKVNIRLQQEFKTDYEGGIMRQNAELTLQSVASDFTKAEWRGPWIFDFQGRDGVGKGTSTAILKVTRGAYDGDLSISTSQLSSTGRFNFPNGLTGERRVVSIVGNKLLPEVEIDYKKVSLTGCEPEAEEKPAVENKNGRVLGA